MSKKENRQQILRYEMTGIMMLALSALALGKLGLVGRYLDVAFIYLAGSWSFLVPVFIAYAATYIMIRRTNFPWTSRHMGLLVLFVTWLTGMEFDFFQRIVPLYPPQSVNLFQATLNAISDMSDIVLQRSDLAPGTSVAAGGGLIGYFFFSISHYLFSTLGTLMALAIGVLVGGALVTERSLVAGIQRGGRWMERRLEGLWNGSKQYIELLFGPD